MRLRIVIDGKQAGASLKRVTTRNAIAVRAAMRASANDAAEGMKREGDSDITTAGRFSTRWTDAWQVTVSEGGGFIRITGSMNGPPPVTYWRVFQYGATIRGKPLLWIPLSFATDAQGIRARDYNGPLFRVNRLGKAPLLLTTGGVPKYFGKESVTIPKKFHLIEIGRKWARRFADLYARNFRRFKGG